MPAQAFVGPPPDKSRQVLLEAINIVLHTKALFGDDIPQQFSSNSVFKLFLPSKNH
jgi:hypothetical protein